MVRHITITITGAAQRLNTGLTGIMKCKVISMHADGANSGIIYVGGISADHPGAVTSSDYGFRIEIPVTAVPPAPSIFEASSGLLDLGEIQVIGTLNDTLHLLLISN